MRAAQIAGALVVLCIGVLLSDYVVATRRAPQDDKLIKALQQQVKTEPLLAPKLAGEQKRVTDFRLGRKKRDKIVTWLLIAVAVVFLTSVKRLVRAKAPLPPKQKTTRLSRKGGRARAVSTPADAALDLTFVDEAVARIGRGKEAAIPLLQAIQGHYRYLPDEALRRVCELTEITPSQIAGTSSFYGQFRRSPVGKHIVKVCHGTACHVAGARQVSEELRRHLSIPEGADTDPDRMFTLEEVACVGCCSLAPVLMVDEQTAGRLTPATACDALQAFEEKEKA